MKRGTAGHGRCVPDFRTGPARFLAISWLALGAFGSGACSGSVAPAGHAGSPIELSRGPSAREAIDAPSERLSSESARGATAGVTPSDPRWIGVQLRPVPEGGAGVGVQAVFPRSPAERAGVRAGDVLVSLDGQPVSSSEDVVRAVNGVALGRGVPLVVDRAGRQRLLRVFVEPMPSREQLIHESFVGRPAPPFEDLEPAYADEGSEGIATRGRVLVVEFWASWCAVCRFLTPILNDWQARYGGQGVEVVGITADSAARAREAADGFGAEYRILADPDGTTSIAYRATVIPTVFLIDSQGVVRDVMIGFSAENIREMQAQIEALTKESGPR